MDPVGGVVLLAELAAQLEQRLGHPAGDVGEHQVGHGFVGATEPLGQRLQERLGQRGPPSEPVVQGVVTQPEQRAVGEGRRGGGASARVEQRQLAEHLAGRHDGQQVLATVDRGDAELDLAVEHDVEPVARLALGEDDVAFVVGALRHRRAQGGRGVVVESGEQRRAHEHVVHALPPCPTP